MARVDDMLPKKIKFKKVDKKRPGQTAMLSISIPKNPYNSSYASAALVRTLRDMGYTKAHIHIDVDNQLIAVEPTEEREGFSIARQQHYSSGVQFSAQLGRKLKSGRYIYTPDLSDEKFLVFKKLQVPDRIKMYHRKNDAED